MVDTAADLFVQSVVHDADGLEYGNFTCSNENIFIVDKPYLTSNALTCNNIRVAQNR